MTDKSLSFIADMHTHTLASTHAYSTVTENAAWCRDHGIKYLGMTDHGINVQDAPDTWHFENLQILPDYICGVRVFRGIEANILSADGSVDIFKDFYYDILEWVNASLHASAFTPSTREEHTRAYINVLKNPYVDVLCHIEGERFDCDFDEVIKAAADAGRLIELNVNRLQKRESAAGRYETILEGCEKYGARLIVSSDAHFYTHIGDFGDAVKLIEKTDFPEKLIINTNEERFLDYLKSRKGRKS